MEEAKVKPVYCRVTFSEYKELKDNLNELRKKSEQLAIKMSERNVATFLINILSFGTYQSARDAIANFAIQSADICKRYLQELERKYEETPDRLPKRWLESIITHMQYIESELTILSKQPWWLNVLQFIAGIVDAIYKIVRNIINLATRLVKAVITTTITLIQLLPYLLIGIVAGIGYTLYKFIQTKEVKEGLKEIGVHYVKTRITGEK